VGIRVLPKSIEGLSQFLSLGVAQSGCLAIGPQTELGSFFEFIEDGTRLCGALLSHHSAEAIKHHAANRFGLCSAVVNMADQVRGMIENHVTCLQ
jgi:hypothetical protein